MYLEGNPLEKKELCNIMACLALNPSLIKVNGKVVTKQVHRTFVLGVKEPAPSTAYNLMVSLVLCLSVRRRSN